MAAVPKGGQGDLNFSDTKGQKAQSQEAQQALTESTVCGEVLRLVFQSDDGMYTVLRLLDENKNEITLVGPLTGVMEGQDIEAKGHWETHKDHGRQFRVKDFKAVLPNSEKGIERYLASGFIPGVGPKLAHKLVSHFGKETLKVLDQYSSRLQEIEGFGKKRIDQIREAWKAHTEQREIYIFLQGLDLSPRRCAQIINYYGSNAPEIVRNNPYRLASDMHGIGFLTADRIAEQLGIAKNSLIRLSAGVIYTLEQLAQDGHVCYPRNQLIDAAADLLKVEPKDVASGLERAIKNGALVCDRSINSNRAEEMIYKRLLYIAETELAAYLKRLFSYPPTLIPPKDIQNGPQYDLLNDQQKGAVEKAFRHHVSIITGGPGVGKTTVVGQIVQLAKKMNCTIYLAAPTGRAAKRLTESCGKKAKTIHRMLKWDAKAREFVYGPDRPLKCDMLILDEVSMLDTNLARHLFSAISPETHVVLVGDRDQLPSVGPGAVLHDLIDCGKIPVTNLTEIYRQGVGSQIVMNAHAVNNGKMPELETSGDDKAEADCFWIDEQDPERVVKIITRLASERIPQRFNFDPVADIQVLAPMNNGVCGTIALNDTMQKTLNKERQPAFKSGNRMFKVNDRVMQVVNNYDKGVFNGELGTIVEINEKDKTFRVMYDVGVVEYDWQEVEEITLAYAVTVHKSQGSEFPVVIMPILTQHYVMLQRNLIYTGMTRARRLLVCVGTRRALAIAIKNSKPLLRYTGLNARLSVS